MEKKPVKRKNLSKEGREKLAFKLKNEKIRLDIKNKCQSDPEFKEYKKKILGRPTKYAPWMDDFAIYFLRDGKSIVELAAELQVNVDTIQEWKKHDTFSAAMSLGMTLCQSWWERESRISLRDKDFNTGLWVQNVKGRFKDDWGDFKKDKVNENDLFNSVAEFVMNTSKGIVPNDDKEK